MKYSGKIAFILELIIILNMLLLSDSQWEFIKEYPPIQGQRKYCLRDIVNAILSILRTGTQWRNLDST